MSAYSLFLYPTREAEPPTGQEQVIHHLADIGLIKGFSQRKSLEPGEKLLEYINFLGCSPTLHSGELECRIRVHHFTTAQAMGGQSIGTLRFPRCRHLIANPSATVMSINTDAGWVCPECGNAGTFHQINWRRSAGFASLFVEIRSIFPREALPNELLLGRLQLLIPGDWAWFYSASSL